MPAPNTNVFGVAGRTFAIVEAGGTPTELTRELATIAHHKFDGTLENAYTAHPHWCPVTGERHAICYKRDVMDRVWHTVMNSEGHIVREEPISVEHGPSIHDCAITPDHVLVFDLPVTFSMGRMIAGYGFPYHWNTNHRARVGVLGRSAPGDSIIWCDVDPCYVFHPANAFVDDAGRIIVDVCAHDQMFAESTFGPGSQTTPFERWTIDLAARSVGRQVVDARPQEFPRYDERRTGQPYRYAVSIALPANNYPELSISGTRLYRHDLVEGRTEDHDFGPARHPGEFVFVPREGGTAEDDGWYVGLVVDMNDQSTDFVILDARDFTGAPTATIHLPHRIPPGFHGNWVSD
jgi:8'-apo-carotenoid 13,14-cleaving dioxygenase